MLQGEVMVRKGRMPGAAEPTGEISRPRFFREVSAASSRRTTRRPAAPSLSGRAVVHDAVDEVFELELQRLRLVALSAPTRRPSDS